MMIIASLVNVVDCLASSAVLLKTLFTENNLTCDVKLSNRSKITLGNVFSPLGWKRLSDINADEVKK